VIFFSYDFIVEKQPIGRLLFQMFCENNTQFNKCCNFLNRVVEYETNDDDGQSRRILANSIAALFAQENNVNSESEPSVSKVNRL
jgi:hypothetical protein